MNTAAGVMKQSVSAFRLAFGAAIFGLGIYLSAVLTNEAVDFSEILSEIHARTELHEIDELLIGILIVGTALLVDLSRNLRKTRKALEIEHLSLERSHSALVAKTAELEQSNAALREAQAEIVEMERMAAVRDVVVSLHHEVLNPLTGVLGAIELLREEGAVAPHRVDALNCAEQAARKIEKLIRGLPDLQRAVSVPYLGKTTMLDLGSTGHAHEDACKSPSALPH